ncbi:MAG TPA: protein-disulfide reductase DsbD N-terminal domain-containing protein, partial [Pyrinomonadaceae bacterium]|nr:protein-disulfide reductase DsbD N-terminal domain-containing protein [Pyrinomonadaceae bacterium]
MPLAVLAQNPAAWSLEVKAGDAKTAAARTFEAKLHAFIEPGWHLYALDQPAGGPIATTIKIAPGSPFELDGTIVSPPPKIAADQNFIVDGKPLETKFFIDKAEFSVPVKAQENAVAADLRLDVRYQLCNDTFCLPPKTVRISLLGSEDVKKTSAVSAPSPTGNPDGTAPQSQFKPNTAERATGDIWAFLWLAATLGALSLLT